MPGPLANLIERELNRLAQLEHYPNFIAKLHETIAPHFKDPDHAAHDSRLTFENVVDDWLTYRFVLRTRKREIVITRRPNVSITDSLKKLAKCNDWERGWFGLPKSAYSILEHAAAETKHRAKQSYYSNQFQASFPSRQSVMPLIEPAIAIVPILATNSKIERDLFLGFLLRVWIGRGFTGMPRRLGPPQHDQAWRFIEQIEACYRPFFAAYDPSCIAPRTGFDIPLRRTTREAIYDNFALWHYLPPTDVEVKVRQALRPWLERNREPPPTSQDLQSGSAKVST